MAFEATGERPRGCPWRALRDPFVAEVIEAHRWADKGALADHYGGEVPPWIEWGVTVFGAALSAVHSTDMRLDREDAEKKRAQAPNANATPPKPRRR